MKRPIKSMTVNMWAALESMREGGLECAESPLKADPAARDTISSDETPT